MCSMIISSEFAQKEKKARLELLKKSVYQMQPQMDGKIEEPRVKAARGSLYLLHSGN